MMRLQTGPHIRGRCSSDGTPSVLLTAENAQVEEIIEQIVTPFCVEVCSEVDKLYSVNQVLRMGRVHMRGSVRDFHR